MRVFWQFLLLAFNVMNGLWLLAVMSNGNDATKGAGIVTFLVFGLIGNLILWFPYKAADKRFQAAKQTQEVASQTRECPHCMEPMRREASVCPHCQRDSEPWRLHEGRWWTKKDGEYYWFDGAEWRRYEGAGTA